MPSNFYELLSRPRRHHHTAVLVRPEPRARKLLKDYPQTALSRIEGLSEPQPPSAKTRARSSPDAIEQIYTVVTRVGRGLYNQIYLDASMCEMRSRHLDE